MLNEIIEIAKNTGNILMRYHKKEFETKSKSQETYDPVTTADLEANKYILGRLKEKFPKMQIVSEEDNAKPVDYSKEVWVIDPLDGTKEFIKGGTEFAVMIALLRDKKPVLGVVCIPHSKELYSAEKGKGAYVTNGGSKEKLNVSKVSSIRLAKEIIRAPYVAKNKFDKYVEGLEVKKLPVSSIGIRLSKVASGEVDFCINTVIKASKWDTAAGEIILEEAGGQITDFEGKPLDYTQKDLVWKKSFIASNRRLHSEVLKLIPKDAFNLIAEKIN